MEVFNSSWIENMNTHLENKLDTLNSTWIESLNNGLEPKMDFWVRLTWDSVFGISMLLAIAGNTAMLLIIIGNTF
jgi:hypothetical protein